MKPDSRIATYSNLLIVVAAFLIHGSVLGRFWLADDPQVLLHAVRYSPLEVMSEKAAWQELSTSNFTPLVTWSFDFDLSVFGPSTVWFYAHQILSLALTAMALRWLMLVLGLPARESLLLALLFLATPPTVHVAGLLMTRHYVEGLLAAVVAVVLWVASERDAGRRRLFVAGSAAAYLTALLSKEVFLLLPLILFALSTERKRWRPLIARLIPFAVALLVYLGWRSWMLGSAGGYGTGNILMHFLDVTFRWARNEPVVTMWFAVTLAICAGTWLRSRSDVAGFVLIAAAAVGPLAGIGDSLEGRHLLVPAVVVLCAALAGIVRRTEGRWRTVGVAILVLTTLPAAMFALFRESNSIQRMEAEGRYVWERTSEDPPLLAGSPAWYLDGIAELDLIWRDESSPDVTYSEMGVLLTSGTNGYVRYGHDGMPSVSYLEDIKRIDDGYLEDAPMSIEIERIDNALRWRLGPECECGWRFYSYPDYQGFEIPREGARIVPRPREQQWFRIERREATGEWTLSPPLALPRDGETLEWERAN